MVVLKSWKLIGCLLELLFDVLRIYLCFVIQWIRDIAMYGTCSTSAVWAAPTGLVFWDKLSCLISYNGIWIDRMVALDNPVVSCDQHSCKQQGQWALWGSNVRDMRPLQGGRCPTSVVWTADEGFIDQMGSLIHWTFLLGWPLLFDTPI